jgi:hypothetical protein
MKDPTELAEIGELRSWSWSLLKAALLSIRRTDHHEMPLDAILGQYLDKCRSKGADFPLLAVRL